MNATNWRPMRSPVDAKTRGIPFVFFTAMRFKGARTEAKQSGAQEFLVKPYKAESPAAGFLFTVFF